MLLWGVEVTLSFTQLLDFRRMFMLAKSPGFSRIGLVVVIFTGNKSNYSSNCYIYLKSKVEHVLTWGYVFYISKKKRNLGGGHTHQEWCLGALDVGTTAIGTCLVVTIDTSAFL